MECGSCSLPYWGTELPGPTREKAPRMELMQKAAKMGKGRASGPRLWSNKQKPLVYIWKRMAFGSEHI